MPDMTRKVVLELLARNRAKGELAAFRGGIDRTFRSVRRMATGLLAMAGVGGLGYMIRQQMKAIDSTAKMSDELQISTRTLAGLDHAAKISGTSIESIHKALEIFVRRLGEARHGVGEGVRGLEMLGMQAEDLINMGTEEAFLKIADSISKTETAAERAGIAYNFFGRQGMQLLNLLQSGSGSVRELIDEAEKLGLTFNRIDAAKVEAANDALTRTKAIFTGLFRQTTIELAPYIEAAATAFNEWATAGEGVGANVTAAFEAVSLAAIKTANLTKYLRAEWVEYKADLLSVQAILEAVMSPGQFPAGAYSRSAVLRKEAQRLREEAKQDIADTLKFYEDLRARTRTPAAELMGGMPTNEIDQLNKRLEEVYGKTIAWSEEFQTAIEMSSQWLEPMSESTEEIAEDSEKIAYNFWRARDALAESNDLLLGVGTAIDALKREVPSAGQLFFDLTIAGAEGLVGGLNEAIWKTRDLDEAMRELGITMAKMATHWLLQTAVTNALGGIGGVLGLQSLIPAKVAHGGGQVGQISERRIVSPEIFKDAPRYHDLQPGERAVIAQDDEIISRPGGFGGSAVESKLDTLIELLSQRQILNATIVDSRDVVTRGQMQGRDGEQFVMRHIQRNQ